MLAERPRGGAERIPDTLQALIAARIDRLPAAARVVAAARRGDGADLHGAARSRSSRRSSRTSATRSTTCCCATSSCARRARRSAASRRTSSSTCSSARSRTRASRRRRAPTCTTRSRSGWSERAGDELLEIRAFHLDQAARLLAELDGAAPPELREEAAEALTKAGRRALSRESFRSARKLLLRAVELAPTLERRYLAGRAAWRLADFPAVVVEMGEVARGRRARRARRRCRAAR